MNRITYFIKYRLDPFFICFPIGVLIIVIILLLLYKESKNNPSFSPPPKQILFCGIENRPCSTYQIIFSGPNPLDPGDEGVTDCVVKKITVYSHGDRFEDVSTLKHEVYHAVLCEHGISIEEQNRIDPEFPMTAHDWIYRVESWDTMMIHDNPEFVEYIQHGY